MYTKAAYLAIVLAGTGVVATNHGPDHAFKPAVAPAQTTDPSHYLPYNSCGPLEKAGIAYTCSSNPEKIPGAYAEETPRMQKRKSYRNKHMATRPACYKFGRFTHADDKNHPVEIRRFPCFRVAEDPKPKEPEPPTPKDPKPPIPKDHEQIPAPKARSQSQTLNVPADIDIMEWLSDISEKIHILETLNMKQPIPAPEGLQRFQKPEVPQHTYEKPGEEKPKIPVHVHETPKEEQPKQETPKEEQPKQETPKEEKPKQEPPKEEQPKQEPPKEEQPKQETPKEEQPKQEPPKEEQPKEVPHPQVQPKQPNQETPKYELPVVEEDDKE